MVRYSLLLLLSYIIGLQCITAQTQIPQSSSKHYNARVSEFENNPQIDSTKIVMLGNSLTENGKDWNAKLCVNNICNYGIIGDNARGMTRRLCQITPFRPKSIFLMCGINDLAQNKESEVVFRKVVSLIDSIRNQAPTTKLYVQSLLPIDEKTKRWKTLYGKTNCVVEINHLLEKYCHDNGITYINLFPEFVIQGTNRLNPDLHSDGLHLNSAGYELWAKLLKPYIENADYNQMASYSGRIPMPHKAKHRNKYAED